MKFSDEFMENLEILAFIIGVMNYNENLSQSDKDEIHLVTFLKVQ